MDNSYRVWQTPDSQPLQRAAGLLLVTNTPKGRGVFTSQKIAKGTVIETCPVLVFTLEESDKYASQTCLQHYTYYWPSHVPGTQTQAIALGLGSMFNHSTLKQNVIWSRDIKAETIIYKAHKDIEAGEELCISYGNGRLWFKDADMEEDAAIEGQDELISSGLGALNLVRSISSTSQFDESAERKPARA